MKRPQALDEQPQHSDVSPLIKAVSTLEFAYLSFETLNLQWLQTVRQYAYIYTNL